VTADEALASLVATLEEIEGILPAGKPEWDGDRIRRLAVERLWITAGNATEEYRRAGKSLGPNWSPTGTVSLTRCPATCPTIASGPIPPKTCLESSASCAG
jgi:hypothetical protein